jgi:MinD-like ATPase involved in chromosome partitioning or flagellar assembly
MQNTLPPIVGFHGGKGGTGRTSAMAFSALAFASIGLKVGLVDCDFEAPTLDILLGVDPERKGETAEPGIDMLLTDRSRTFNEYSYYIEKIQINVLEEWSKKEFGTRINTTELFNLEAQAFDVDAALKDANLKDKAMWLLPCSRVNNLNVDCLSTDSSTTVDKKLKRIIDDFSNINDLDIVLVDMRNGLSDAAAVSSKVCDIVIHTLYQKTAHVRLLAQCFSEWYPKHLGYAGTVFCVYTLDPTVSTKLDDKAEALYQDGKQEALLQSINDYDVAKYTAMEKVAIGRIPPLQSLLYSDFVLAAYQEVEMYTCEIAKEILRYVSIRSENDPKMKALKNRVEHIGAFDRLLDITGGSKPWK